MSVSMNRYCLFGDRLSTSEKYILIRTFLPCAYGNGLGNEN